MEQTDSISMEQTEAYKEGQAIIKALEKRLAICTNINELSEQTARDARKEIEEHFAQCANALAARKEELLREVTEKVNNHKKNVEDSRAQVVASIAACNKAMETATLMYPIQGNVAEVFLKGLKGVPIPNIFEAQVITELPTFMLLAIQEHGKVGISSRFSVVDSITTFAGSEKGNLDGNGVNARFNNPWGICVNPFDDCLYVCDRNNNEIKKITMQGTVSTFAADNGLNGPSGIVINKFDRTFFVTNTNANTISKISPKGTITVFVGSGQVGKADGVGLNASFSAPVGVTIDPDTGNLFVSDAGNHLIRKITSRGEVSTLAGSTHGFIDGNGRNAMFNCPCRIAFDVTSQSLLVCDYGNTRLRRVLLNGDVATVLLFEGGPVGVAITSHKTTLVCAGRQVFKVILRGQNYESVVIAGSGTEPRKDGNAELCGFDSPYGIAVHEPSHTCFVTDYHSHLIRKISFL